MVEHDVHIGEFLDKPDEPGFADNPIVFYYTGSGSHQDIWPDSAAAEGDQLQP